MFNYVFTKDYCEICVFRSNSDSIKKFEEIAGVILESTMNIARKLEFNLKSIEDYLIAKLVDVKRPVVLPPEFKGRSYNSATPEQRELFGSVHNFYTTPGDILLLSLVDIFLVLSKSDTNEQWLYVFSAKTHKDYRNFMKENAGSSGKN